MSRTGSTSRRPREEKRTSRTPGHIQAHNRPSASASASAAPKDAVFRSTQIRREDARRVCSAEETSIETMMISGFLSTIALCQTTSDEGLVDSMPALAVVAAGVDLELDAGGWPFEELGEDGFEVFDGFLEC
jgi:hypothetical protein